MAVNARSIFDLLKESASEWSSDNASRLGAALAYYTVFSLAPLLIIVIAVVGLLWGNQTDAVQGRLMSEIEGLMGPDGASLIDTMLENASRPGSGNIFATVVGVAALLFGATGAFAQLQGALNTIWGVRPNPERGWMNLLTTRLLSFGMILVVGFLLLVSLVISAGLAAVEDFLTGLAPGTQLLMQGANLLLSFGIITLLFAMIYRYLPDVKIAWRDVWMGAAVTALLFTLGKYALGVYLGNSSTASTYGAAGSLVVLLVWIYYSAQIFFFGAEVTEVYARRYGSRIRPDEHAVLIDEAEEAEGEAPDARHVSPPQKRPAAVSGRATPAWKRAAPLVLAFLAGRLTRRGG